MKTRVQLFLVALSVLFVSQATLKAQTTLVAGDILFTSYNGNPAAGTAPDTFSFVVLTPIATTTVIYFTERGYQGGGVWQASGGTEGTLSLTISSALAIGDEIQIAGIGAPAATRNGVSIGTTALVAGGNVTTGLSLSNAGDQVIAFQGGAGDPTNVASVMIAGISWALSCGTTSDAGWNGAGCAYGPQSSSMPPGLTGGTNAFLAGTATATPNNDHGKFNCFGCPYGTVAALKAAIMTKTNWLFSATGLTVYNIPPGCNYYSTCTAPAVTGQPSNSTICAGANTSFTITATGTSLTYQWQENNGGGFVNLSNAGVYSNVTTTTLNITGATAGMTGYLYRCVVTGGCGSANSNQATLTVSQPVINANTQTNISCFGGNNGAASVIPATGGVSPYTYNWTPGNPTGDGTVSVTGLIAGTWTCTVTDNIGCTGTRTFNITQPTAIAVTPLSQTNISCFGGSNGAASINTPTGGAGGFTYNWTPGNPTGDGTVSVTGLTVGAWTCTVTDANSCTATQTFNITQPTAIVITPASQTNISCFGGSNGAASINTPTGGAGGFTYNWTPGNPTGDGTVSVTGLTVGVWTCTVTDANSCTATRTFNITQPAAIVVTPASQTNISCFGGSNGAASINTPTGGAGGFTYNWTPGNPTGDGTVSVTGLTAGSWTCTVTDANSCTATQTFNITQPTAIVVTPASQTNISCFGGSNGAASINTPTGGAGGFTYNWTPGNPTGDGTVSVTGLIAGVWTCTVTDANSCTAQQTFNITQPAAIVVTPASQTNISCFGGSNGAASINTPTGGAGGFTYNWTPGNPTGDGTVSVTGLAVGVWTCTVTDANSCTATQTFNITQPAAIVVTPASQTNISCFGGSNGAASINTPTGGAGGFTYNWTPGNPTGDGTVSVTGLTVGVWTCTVTDANSCTATQTFNITQPTAIVVTPASQTNISCNGGSNGAASINTPTGGAGGFTYNWTPGNPTGDGTVSVTGLTVGVWTCTVTDANACTAQQTFNITQPSAIVVTPASQTNISCNGGSNGAASINTPTGGAGGYTYNWTPGNPTGDGTVSVTGLTVGVWTCTVTDANSCTATQTFNITQPAIINASTSSTPTACVSNTGTATVSGVTGGTGGYTYSWAPSGGTAATATSLGAGTYTCTVTDANTCTRTFTAIVSTVSGPSLTAASQTNISCFGGSNGAASVNAATGGTSPYTYNWTPGNPTGDGTVSVTGLTVGVWTCTVTDANSCTAQQTFNITQPAAIVVTPASQTNISCNGGSNGAASINTPTGGAGGFTYNWTPGNPTGDGTVSVTGLAVGVWTCTVTDANACTAQQTFNITQPAAIVVTPASQTNISCFGGSNGAASINTPTGGAGGFTYNWTPGNPTGDGTVSVTGLTAGGWTCTVTDANSCTATQTFNITQPAAIVVTPASQTNISCNGGSNGAASINTPTGGAGGFTYNWTPGNPTGDGTVSVTGLTVGVWTCTVTDANSCTAQQTFNITQPAIINASTSSTPTACVSNTGTATVSGVTGGTGGYTYSWAPSGGTAATATSLGAGTYTCTVTDANTCTRTFTAIVSTVSGPSLTAASQTNISCFGGSNGAASVNAATGGTSPYTYNWTPGNPTGDGTVSVTGLTVGVWTCTVTDANSCTAQQTFNITQPTAIVVTPASQTNISCFGGSNGAASINTPTGGAGGFTYNWTPGNPTGDGTVSVTGLTVGVWTCTVTDANACTAQQTFNITQPTAIVVTPASQTNISCFGGSNGAASINTPTGGAGGFTYNWTPGNPTGDGTVSITGLTAGGWTCTVTDANSCTAQQTFNITQPAAIVVTPASQTNISCFGGSNGAASINTPTGGAGGFTYNWTPGNPAGDGTVSVTGLTVGVWTCTVTDANSCTATQTFNITQPSIINASTSSTPTACVSNTGTATVSGVTGGTGGYTYSWAPSGGTAATATSLGAGTYTCTVTDANTCTRTFTAIVSTVSGPSLTAASQTNISCFGGSNGAASVNAATGGTSPYTYNWTPGNPTGDGTISVTGLTVGVWTCTVTDANSCTAQQTFNITQPTAIVVTPASQTNISCNGGSNGAASINTPTGGAGGFTYNWTPGNPTGDGTVSVTGLAVGVWTCTVTDANACTAQQTFNITQPSTLAVSPASQTNVTCFGGSNGAASINTPTGGAGGFTYNWTPGNPTGDGTVSVTGLTIGVWTCTVTDANLCTAQQTFNITQPAPVSVGFTVSPNDTVCAGTTVTLSGTGANSYSWTGGITNGVGFIANTTTTYTVTGTNLAGCTNTATATITVNPLPTVGTNVTPNDTVCVNTLVTLSGTGANTYTWSGGVINNTPFAAAVLGNTTYTVTGTSVAGCSNTASIQVHVNALPVVNLSGNTNLCPGGTVTLTGSSGGTSQWYVNGVIIPGANTNTYVANTPGVYNMIKTNANGCFDSAAVGLTVVPVSAPTVGTNVTPGTTVCENTSVTLSGTGASSYTWTGGITNGVGFNAVTTATYTVTGTDGNSCTNTSSVTITVNPLPLVGASVDNDTICLGGSVIFTGSGANSYTWDNGVTDGIGFNPTATNTYTVIGTDGNNCSNTNSVTVIVNPLPTIGYNVTPNDTVCIGTSVTLNGTGAGSYSWTGGITDGNPFTPLANGTYTVTGTDANLCSGTNTVAIVVNSLPVVNLGPDVVQPNPPAVLDAGAGFSAYLWNTTANTQTISVNTNGTYFVSVTDSNGCSNADTINVNFTSGINNPDGSQATIELYPVPTENILNLSIQNLHSSDLVVTILDMNGKIVEAVKVGNFEGNYNKTFITETYRAGMYTLVIQSAEKTTNLRFIKK